MPILWRYLFREYLKIFFLSILAFICVLLITRLKQIAIFATLASDIFSLILFILYQFPYILPIAISISCLISSTILFQRMSIMHEMTAFRSLGISLKQLLEPLLLLAIVLSILNFFIISELTPRCKYKTKELFYKNTSMNPLILLQRRQKMSNIKDSYVEISTKNKDLVAKDLLIISPNKSNERLCMFTAKNLMIQNENLIGKNVSLISYINSNKEKYFDNLMIENQSNMSTKSDAITQFIKAKEWDMNITAMPIKMLLIHTKQKKTKYNKKQCERAQIEIARRFGFALSTFCFTFVGASFGISIYRVSSKKNILIVSLLTLLILFSFTLGRALKRYVVLSIIAFILPQIIAVFFTANRLKKISRGYE
jgi:lipopolysaccharide export system permease protein